MAKTISEIKEHYIRQGLRGDGFRRALKNDPDYQKLLRIRRRRVLAEESKKKTGVYDGPFLSRWPQPKVADRSLAARAARLDQKIENYIKNRLGKLLPAGLKKILTKIAKNL